MQGENPAFVRLYLPVLPIFTAYVLSCSDYNNCNYCACPFAWLGSSI
jgi:hypothetical protein